MTFYTGCGKIFVPLLSLPIFQVFNNHEIKHSFIISTGITQEKYCGFDTPSPYLPKKRQFDNHKNKIILTEQFCPVFFKVRCSTRENEV